MYFRYHPFIQTFLKELDAEIIFSEETNKEILNLGVKYCVDEACLPIKIFHGHVASIKEKCDLMIIPRIMKEEGGEYICPKFCGLPEMIINSIPNMPVITYDPLYLNSQKKLQKWIVGLGRHIINNKQKINDAYEKASHEQQAFELGIKDDQYSKKVALVGHPYCVHDSFFNMNIVKKLNEMGVGVITEETIPKQYFDVELKNLYKKPFWDFTKNAYGFCMNIYKNESVDGIIYLSSFGCGIDSVSVELIKNEIREFPFLILKVDEHTGEAGIDTRIEAFINMLGEEYLN
ncbi:MAG: acyl-CoA dehydratase activase-related protein [Clostridia bacterium]|nr:acyl-CoA dehydratase activase-related protein [Clostridia bacterium]